MTYPKPLADRVIVLPDEKKKEEVGAFDFGTKDEAPNSGVVKAVGIGLYASETGVLIPMEVVVGDAVKFGRISGGITIEGVPHVIIRQSDISIIL